MHEEDQDSIINLFRLLFGTLHPHFYKWGGWGAGGCFVLFFVCLFVCLFFFKESSVYGGNISVRSVAGLEVGVLDL